MLKSVPYEIINRAAKEIVDYIFEESGVHPYSMTLIEGIMDYSLVAEWALTELDCSIAAEKIKHVMDYRKSITNSTIPSPTLKTERDDGGTIIFQEVINDPIEAWVEQVNGTVFK